MYKGHVLELNAIYGIHGFGLTFFESIFALREEALYDDSLSLVFAGTRNSEWHFVAIRDFLDTIHIGVIPRDERDISTEAYGWQCCILCYRVEDERQVTEGDFEALSAVVGNDHKVHLF